MPGVQMPHCAAPCARNAVDEPRRSSVVAALRSSRSSRRRPAPPAPGRRRPAAPSRSTVQAPQSPASQPILVPVSPKSCAQHARQASSNGCAATRCCTPLTVSVRAWERSWRDPASCGPPRALCGDASEQVAHELQRRRAAIAADARTSSMRREMREMRPDAMSGWVAAVCRSTALRVGKRCATAEQAPTAMRASQIVPSRIDVEHAGHHGDRDDEIAARAELRKCAVASLLRNADAL